MTGASTSLIERGGSGGSADLGTDIWRRRFKVPPVALPSESLEICTIR